MGGGNNREEGDETVGRDAAVLVADGGRHVTERGRYFDDVFAVLADPHRRYALYYLREEECTSLIDLARQIAAWEHDRPADSVSDDARAEMEIALYHTHLPKLREAGVVDYDERSETVVFRDPPSLVERCLEYCAPLELPE